MLAVALTGYGFTVLRTWERVWIGLASTLVNSPSRTATVVGLSLAMPILVRQMLFRREIVRVSNKVQARG